MKRYRAFITSEEEIAFLETIRKYVDKEIMPVRMQLDEDYTVFEKVYGGLVKLGIQKRGFSPRYGGLGIRSVPTVCALTEEISRGDSGISLHALIIPWCLAAAMGARNTTIMDKYIPMFCEDTPRCGCLAITEPAGGCNIEDGAEHAMTVRTTAKLEGDEWVINGEKMWPQNGGSKKFYRFCQILDDLTEFAGYVDIRAVVSRLAEANYKQPIVSRQSAKVLDVLLADQSPLRASIN